MRVHVEARLDYDFPERVDSLLQIEAAVADDQAVRDERLVFDPPLAFTRRDDPATGERRVAFTCQGRLAIAYDAVVEIADRDMALAGAAPHAVADLPIGALSYLRGSRYCPSDIFETIADQKFGALHGGARVAAIAEWIAGHLEYRIGCSDARTTALETYVQRAGVCRDFAHLAVTLCRASDIPARVASVYAPALERPDFHAVAEVFVGGRWRLLDPTGLAPVDGLVRIAYGRDAADVAFLTIFGKATMVAQSVAATKV
ncbi:transglutaminase family protein [Caulobacter sp. BK020]|uniref:transglutaminase-like domain-containing protein n=1 Tax=Caulobacter sp. BK020 TaxID=2512117 RepID=UPI00104AB9B8|nr:transglutaminase family protein [Caulobacter sp. BK020]TCS13690.1 transglutaminase-like putative cysteine protease [Caulobacter sp. BK020]